MFLCSTIKETTLLIKESVPILTATYKAIARKMQEIRKSRKDLVNRFPNATLYLQVVGSGAPGASSSLYVFTGQTNFMFNCGEGTQRVAQEHKIKLGMLEDILVTHKSWKNVGGIPGMLLTLQDAGSPNITLHGPPGIHSLYHDTKSFMRFNKLKLAYHHYAANNGVFDCASSFSILAVPIHPEPDDQQDGDQAPHIDHCDDSWSSSSSRSSSQCSSRSTPPPTSLKCSPSPPLKRSVSQESEKLPHSGSEEQKGSKRGSPMEEGAGTEAATPASKRPRGDEFTTKLAVAYICRPPVRPGRLLLKACLQAGVPAGPLLGQLKNGKDVTLEDGTVVRAAVVTEPDEPGPVFAVVEAPSAAYVDSLCSSAAFLPYQSAGASSPHDVAKVVVHFSPAAVVALPSYQGWMARFSHTTTHIFINDASTCLGSVAVHRHQQKLNYLDPRLFPLLADSSIPTGAGGGRDGGTYDARKLLKDKHKDENNAMQHDSGVTTSQNGVNNDTAKNSNINHMNSSNQSDAINEKLSSKEINLSDSVYKTIDARTTMDNISGSNIIVMSNIVDKRVDACTTKENTSVAEFIDNDKNSEGGCSALAAAAVGESIGPCVQASTLLIYNLRPISTINRSMCLVLNHETFAEEIRTSGCLPYAGVDKCSNGPSTSEVCSSYPAVTFLGTASCSPSKTRNPSGILLHLDADSYMVLDCSEGSWGQMVRLFGLSKAKDILTKVTAIYVSHLHADHHLGFINLLQQRRQALTQKGDKVTQLLLLAPYNIYEYLKSYHHNFEPILQDFRLVSNRNFLPMRSPQPQVSLEEVFAEARVANLRTTHVWHCANAYGVAITTTAGATVVYSGDTMPCPSLVELGQDCDLLIHEATMEDDLVEEALAKTHSTIGQALDVARRMHAKHVLLTHFSQRYAKVPLIDTARHGAVAVAFDNMTVRIGDVPRVAELYPQFMKMFADDVEEMRERTAKLKRSRERSAHAEKDLMSAIR